ncbi:XdhC family protein [candidate division KSB1 bacterium]|nr:XdhC family protein [candidate division KSB1 bacterium]
MDIFEKVAEATNRGIPLVLATVIDVKGSAPRAAGAKMIVWQDGHVDGSIGGGAVEKAVVEAALKLFARPEAQVYHYDLTDLNMQCGGDMTVFLEPVIPKPQLVLFGGGHIGLALATIADLLDFAVTVVDDRPEFATPERFPRATVILAESYASTVQKMTIAADAYIVIVTHKHLHDQEIIDVCATKPFKYLGMIGSRSKVAKSFNLLADRGVAKEIINRIHSPIGLNIAANTPAEIAVAIAAEMIAIRNGADVSATSMKLSHA